MARVCARAQGKRAAGTEPRLKVTPAWQMRALGLVNRTVREINEMRYELDEPFIIDATRAETELDLRATPQAGPDAPAEGDPHLLAGRTR